MGKLNKVCACDGTRYSYCPHCSADDTKPSWMNMFCSENCKDLFQLATDYLANEITKEQAKEIIKNLDLTNKNNFRKSVLDVIDGIMKEDAESAKIESLDTVENEKVDTVEAGLDIDVDVDEGMKDDKKEQVEILKNEKNEHSDKKNYNKKKKNRYFSN